MSCNLVLVELFLFGEPTPFRSIHFSLYQYNNMRYGTKIFTYGTKTFTYASVTEIQQSKLFNHLLRSCNGKAVFQMLKLPRCTQNKTVYEHLAQHSE